MSKRQRFLIITFFLTGALFFVSQASGSLKFVLCAAVPGAALVLTYLSLKRELDGIEYLTLLVTPFLLTLGFSLIFIFFPNFNTLFTVGILVVFFISFYSCILACNIFSAAAAKNLLLLKPAQTAFLFVILAIFFLLNTHVFKLGLNFIVQAAVDFFLLYLLAFLVFWSHTLNVTAQFDVQKAKQWAFLAATAVFLSTWWLVFLKLEPFFRSLVLTAGFNAILGIFIAKQARQFSNKIVFEYVLIPLSALVFSIVAG